MSGIEIAVLDMAGTAVLDGGLVEAAFTRAAGVLTGATHVLVSVADLPAIVLD
ncbi:hypothetical protein [Actinomadura sp. WMMB 499]|uniref:hypothetical protein n=1 Tax=Actinomadura sp. WMMB 499 TaxID=1219491 RepID=UPI00159D70C1|nr:hypothetical protein [Actinomadura sp. WMMB 499]